MSTIELKKLLISKISEIDDEAFLLAINTILNSKCETIMTLSGEQKKSIQKAQKEYEQGRFQTNDVVNEEMEKWLKE